MSALMVKLVSKTFIKDKKLFECECKLTRKTKQNEKAIVLLSMNSLFYK